VTAGTTGGGRLPGTEPGPGHATRPRRAAVLGLGEAGRRYAADLAAAGWVVHGYDPAPTPTPDGVSRAPDPGAAVAGAEIVLGLTGAAHAVAVAEQVAEHLPTGACFADFNSAGPQTKRDVQRALRGAAGCAADVAVLAPVPRAGAGTPLVVAGPGAPVVASCLGPLGADVEVLDAPMGAAATRKLLRSVFMKGLAAVVLEAVAAGRAAGCESWVRDQIAGEIGGHALVDRLVEGSRTHAARRVHEVEAAKDVLAELATPDVVCDAALWWLRSLADEAATR
jgi:3-hydroxyisobutyrate dehydrogenase-like beta-hydroxyacid dehydrogenase